VSPAEQENDSLNSLEERVLRAVQLVASLRKERDAAVEEAAQSRAEVERLAAENQSLQTERKQVRTRIEKLLGQIDQLGAS
jgi:FtsZ-binding cell division protein ZapB